MTRIIDTKIYNVWTPMLGVGNGSVALEMPWFWLNIQLTCTEYVS